MSWWRAGEAVLLGCTGCGRGGADRRGSAVNRRFELEARAVAALNHPNIVAIYDVGDGYKLSPRTTIRLRPEGSMTAVSPVETARGAPPAELTAHTEPPANSSGSGQAAAINQDGSLNSADSPIRVGDVLVLYATGEGRTTPPGIDGKPATVPLPTPFLVVTAMVGGQPAVVQYAGGAPGFVAGLMQVNVVIPVNISPGAAVPVVLKVADTQSQGGVTIAVGGN